MKHHLFTSKYLKTAGFFAIVITALIVVRFVAAQQTTVTFNKIGGMAWSDMPNTSNEVYPSAQSGQVGRGAGWISLNNAVGTSSGLGGNVLIDSSGNLTGYAWTPNMGWIQFDPAGPYPTSSITTASTPTQIDLTTGNWSGWARACAVFASGCSGSLASTNVTGGWDGWISLRGTGGSYPYGVNSDMTTGATTGHAWGSDILGWIDFSQVQLVPTTSQTCTGTADGLTYTYTGTTLPIPCQPLVCQDTTAINYGGTLPCTYGLTCTDPAANNQGQALPCTYPPGICADPAATNHGQALPCTYPPGTCTDPTALNFHGPLPCTYTAVNAATVTLTSTGCSAPSTPTDTTPGTTTLSWSSIGIAPTNSCTAVTNGNTSISGFTGTVSSSNTGISISGIPRNGTANNFTITCNALANYTPIHPTSTVSVTCANPACNPLIDPACTPAPGGPIRPVYKEN
jgi:hypothetical protein